MRHILKLAAIVLLAVGSTQAFAATKLNLLYIPGGDFVPSYVAKDQGIFERHGLDVDMSIAQNGSVISAALAADQAQIGVPTPPVLLQANEQGLDLVIVAGATVLPFPAGAAGVIARNDSNLKGPNYKNVDLALSKRIPLKGSVTLNPRLEAYNLLNGMNWFLPSTTISESNFGQVVRQADAYFGRQLQYTLRVEF